MFSDKQDNWVGFSHAFAANNDVFNQLPLYSGSPGFEPSKSSCFELQLVDKIHHVYCIGISVSNSPVVYLRVVLNSRRRASFCVFWHCVPTWRTLVWSPPKLSDGAQWNVQSGCFSCFLARVEPQIGGTLQVCHKNNYVCIFFLGISVLIPLCTVMYETGAENGSSSQGTAGQSGPIAGSTGGVSKAAKGQGSAEKEEQTGNQKRARRQWESWSAEDKNSFFEGLYEVRVCICLFKRICSYSPSIISYSSLARLSAALVYSTGKTLKQSRTTLPWSTRKEANQLTWLRTRSRSAIFTTEPGTRSPNTLTLPTVSCPLSLSSINKQDFIDYMWTIHNSRLFLSVSIGFLQGSAPLQP